MDVEIDQIIYQLNNVYPRDLSINQLADKTKQPVDKTMDLLNRLNEYQWPLELNHRKVSLNLPLFSKLNIRQFLPDDLQNKLTFKSFHTIDSTNVFTANHLDELDDWTVVLAHHQSKGKGRMDRAWLSPVGDSISMSLALKERELDDEKLKIVSLITALALVKALGEINIKSQIKWPNDVLVNGKKVAGILCQMEAYNAKKIDLVIGLGININQNQFPEEIKSKASSLSIEYDKVINPNTVIANFIFHLHQILESAQPNHSIISEIKGQCLLMNELVLLSPSNGPKEKVRIVDLAEDGGLIVQDPETQLLKTVYSGEVSVRKIDGSYI